MKIKNENGFSYFESNGGNKNLILLHGLFGALSNFESVVDEFANDYNVVIPVLPLYTLEAKDTHIDGLLSYLEKFINFKSYKDIHLLGNSLGGHIAQLYVLSNQEKVKSLILTASSGLFESGLGDGYPKRGDIDYIRKKTQKTFYDPEMATEELISEVYDIVNDRLKAIRIVYLAKSALRHNLEDKLQLIKRPTLLIWGENDTITPCFIAEKFNKMIFKSKLIILPKCGHAPMMEQPIKFNTSLRSFLQNI